MWNSLQQTVNYVVAMAIILLRVLGQNDQNQQTWLKIKTAAIFDWITFFIWNLQWSFISNGKIYKYLYVSRD